jgi:hypothetical protein
MCSWFSLTLQSLNIIDFFRMLNIFSTELHPLLVYFYSPTTSMISVFLFRKKTYNLIFFFIFQRKYHVNFVWFWFFFHQQKQKSMYRILRTIGRYFFSSSHWLRPIYCKQNRHFYRDFFLRIPDFFNFILV